MADSPEPEVLEEEAQEQEVELNEPPAEANGHTQAPPSPPGLTPVEVTKRTTVFEPTSQYQQPAAPRQAVRRAAARPPVQQSSSARDQLDDYLTRPEADGWELSISRYHPVSKVVNGQHVGLPLSNILQLPLMPLETLRTEIAKAWGGGDYRVTVNHRDTKEYVPGIKTIVLSIPIEQHEPKLKRYEQTASESAPPIPMIEQETDEETDEIIKDTKRQLAEDRRDAVEDRRLEKRIKRAQMMQMLKEIEQNGKPATNGTSHSEIDEIRREMRRQQEDFDKKLREEREASDKRLKEEREAAEKRHKETLELTEKKARDDREAAEKKSREDREAADKKAREDRDTFMSKISELTDQIKALKNAPAAPVEDQNAKMFMFMADQQTKMITALAPKNDGVSGIGEIMKAGMENIRSVNELAIKASARDSSGEKELFKAIITSALGRDRGESSTETALKFMQIGQNQTKQLFEMMQGFQQSQQSAEDEEGYNPQLGILGNVGKMIYMGVKAAMKAAENNPQIAEALMKIFQRKDPADITDHQAIEYARRMEIQRQGQIVGLQPRGLPTAQPPGVVPQQAQQPIITPNAPQQQARPGTVQPPGVVPPGRTPVGQVARKPDQSAQVPPFAPKTPERVQAEVASELTGEIEGVEASPPANPGPPVQQQEVPPDENEEEEDEEEQDMSTPESRLSFYVHQCITEAIGDVVDKRAEHGWPVTANAYLNGDFKEAYVKAEHTRRIQMLAEWCEEGVWNELNEKLEVDTAAGGTQYQKFNDAVDKLAGLIQQS